MPATDPFAPAPSPNQHWLTLVGINEDGLDGLSYAARQRIQSAVAVFGGKRHLSLASALIRGTAHPWHTPFEQNLTEVLRYRGRPTCVLASGDPFMYGVGSVLAHHLSIDEVRSIPAPSVFSLAASRLLWPLPETSLLSFCGHSLELLRPHLQPNARILALTPGSEAPAALAQLLCANGFGDSRVTVLEALGGQRERIRSAKAASFALEDIQALNTTAIEVIASSQARILPRAAGLAEALFETDGQITKREVRAVTLSALAPRRGERLWDIGAGCGSVAIEWLLADPSLHAIAIEQRSERAARIRRNAIKCGVPGLQVIEGTAPATLAGLEPPDAVFIGGGALSAGVIDTAQRALRTQGRLVVNAVTLETEAALTQRHAHWGGTLIRIDIARASPLGGAQDAPLGWRPAMPVVQWVWTKP